MTTPRPGTKKSGKATDKSAEHGKAKRTNKAELVSRVIQKIEQKLDKADVKPSVGDFIKLLQLEKELQEEEQPTEIKVSWVEREVTEPASEK